MSTRARLCIREVARELEEDMELGAEGDLNAAAPSTASFPPPRPPQLASRRRALSLAVVTAVISVAVVTAAVARLYSTHPQRLYAQRLSAGSRKPRVQRSE